MSTLRYRFIAALLELLTLLERAKHAQTMIAIKQSDLVYSPPSVALRNDALASEIDGAGDPPACLLSSTKILPLSRRFNVIDFLKINAYVCTQFGDQPPR